MKILVVGGGGREHALAWALSRHGHNSVISAPGNPGMARIGPLFPVPATDIEAQVDLARANRADLVVVGPEVPLVMGLADRLRESGIPCFGPGRDAARLEGSKWFAKEIMESAKVPTASGRVFSDAVAAMDFMGSDAGGYVIKADGLAAGKGVFLPANRDEAGRILEDLFSGKLRDSGLNVVIEERLKGREVSILAICNGRRCVVLPPSRDHKRAGDGDTGPNTGGMGAICPPPELDEDFKNYAEERIIQPILDEFVSRGIDYRGVLYAGLMITDRGPMVLEFNVRFGDPETQAVLPMIESDLAGLCRSAAMGEDLPDGIRIREGASTCVVMASGGYPSSYEKGFRIDGLEDVEDSLVFQAGTSISGDGLVTSGGRVLSVVAIGPSLEESMKKAYEEVGKIHFSGCYFRKDIGR